MARFTELLRSLNNLKAITASQIGFPAYVLLTTAAQLASFRLQPERFELLSRAVTHGLAIARQSSCLALARWEEGWERPVGDWRRELGISDPADNESYGLGTTASATESASAQMRDTPAWNDDMR